VDLKPIPYLEYVEAPAVAAKKPAEGEAENEFVSTVKRARTMPGALLQRLDDLRLRLERAAPLRLPAPENTAAIGG
jgi:hypothetical protein